jgi:hypothetical protein
MEWKQVVRWEGLYEVSFDGQIKSCRTEKIIYTAKDKDGYLITQLCNKGKRLTVAVHRVVAEAFLGEKPSKNLTVNHIDGNKQNNCANNLEYVSKSEQMYHAYKLGLKKPVFNSNQKLKKEQILEIKSLYKKGCRKNGSESLAKRYNVSPSTILNIVNNKTYKHIEGATTMRKQ